MFGRNLRKTPEIRGLRAPHAAGSKNDRQGIIIDLLPAALGNTFLVFYLVLDLWRGERGFHFPSLLAWFHRLDGGTAELFSARR